MAYLTDNLGRMILCGGLPLEMDMATATRRRANLHPIRLTLPGVVAPASAYTTSLSSTSGASGAPVTMTFTPTGGAWPAGEVITPTVSGVAGTLAPTTVPASGSGAVTCTFTPSAAGTASLSSTTSPAMTNTTGARSYTASAGGTTAIAYTTSLSSTSGGPGTAVTLTFIPTGGAWPAGEVITPTASGLAGTLAPPTINASGSGSVTCTFTPSATGTATLSSTTSPGMTNTTGAQSYAVSSSGYAALSGITWNQPRAIGPQLWNNADNFKAIVGSFAPIGGIGPFTYSVAGNNFNFGMLDSNTYRAASSSNSWVVGPLDASNHTTDTITLQVTDGTGASVTQVVTVNSSLSAGAIVWLQGNQTWPDDVTPSMSTQVFNAAGDTVNDSVALSDPSGVWTMYYGNVTTASGRAAPPGSYPITLTSTGSQGSLTANVTLTVFHATLSPMQYVNTIGTVSTSILAGTAIGKIIGSTPNNTRTLSLTDATGTLAISNAGVVSIKTQPAQTGGLPFSTAETEGTQTRTDSFSITVAQGNTLAPSNMAMAINSSLQNDIYGQSVGTPSVTGITGTKQWTLVSQDGYNDHAVDLGGAPNRFVINQATGAVTAPYWLSGNLDGVSAQIFNLLISCTDGINTCTQTFSPSVAWAPISRTYYIGRGMAAAHPGFGFENLAGPAGLRPTIATSDTAPHTGTYHVLVYADADPDYYADDTGTRAGGDYGSRFPWSGPIIFEGVANAGVAQPRTGGASTNNSQSGGDMRGKGFWVFGNGDCVIKNIEMAYCHSFDGNHATEALRKDGSTYGNMTVQNCFVHDSDNGLMAGNYVQGSMLVEGCEVTNCGTSHEGSGACHNAYIGEISEVIWRNNVSRRATVGHLLKVRARTGKIYNNRIFDGVTGNASNCINIPEGGVYEIYSNKIVKGVMAQNPNAIRYNEDYYKGWQDNTLSVHDNDIDVLTMTGNHYGTPAAVGHIVGVNAFGVASSVTIANNTMSLYPGVLAWRHYLDNGNDADGTYPGATVETGTTTRALPITLDVTRPYLSGVLSVAGPLFRLTQYGGDSFSNFEGVYQWQDRDQINVASGAGAGTVLCNTYASNDLVNHPNPFAAGTTWSISFADVYYTGNTLPWAPAGRYSVTTNADGSGTLKVAGSLVRGTDYVQLRATAPNGTLCDCRYPVVVA